MAGTKGFRHRNLPSSPDRGLIDFFPSQIKEDIGVITGAFGKDRVEYSRSIVSQSWFGLVKLVVATCVAYFLVGWLGLALRAESGLYLTHPAGVT